MADESFLLSQDDRYIEEADSVCIGVDCQPQSIPTYQESTSTKFPGLERFNPDILQECAVETYLEVAKS